VSEVHFYRPEAPESIWIDRGPNGGWMFRTEKLHDSVRQYVPADTLEAQLKTVLDREAETHRRHDAKVEAQAAELIEQARIIGMGAERELALRAEIERLREAVQKLSDHACHDDDCQHGVWSDPTPCTCGYEDAWRAVSAALGEPTGE